MKTSLNFNLNLIVALLFVWFIVFSRCGRHSEEAVSETTETLPDSLTLTDEQVVKAGVVTDYPQYRLLPDYIEASGQIDLPPQNLITITAPLGGFIKQTPLLEGMRVKKGDLLVELEHPDYIQLQQDYLQAVSHLNLAKAEWQRQEELARENIAAQKSMEKARADYTAAQTQVDALRARLLMLHINPNRLQSEGLQPTVVLRSPISGFVTRVQITTGEYVAAHRELFRLIDPGHLHAEIFVFEKDLPRLHEGQQVIFRILNDTATRYGKVFLIGKELTPERTIRVHCHLDRNYPDLIPGLYLQAQIVTGEHRVLGVPEDAVVIQGNNKYVFTVHGTHTFKLTPVVAGHSAEGFVEVRSPVLSDKSRIVFKGAYTLLSMLRNKGEEDEG